MTPEQQQWIDEQNGQLAKYRQHLRELESGRMRWIINGSDRTEHKAEMLKGVIASMERLLGPYAEGVEPKEEHNEAE